MRNGERESDVKGTCVFPESVSGEIRKVTVGCKRIRRLVKKEL